MSNTIDTAAAESLRNFAVANGELAFAHLVTAAMLGEEWAIERVQAVLDNAIIDPTSKINTCHALNLIRFADTTRPDGAIARSFQP